MHKNKRNIKEIKEIKEIKGEFYNERKVFYTDCTF